MLSLEVNGSRRKECGGVRFAQWWVLWKLERMGGWPTNFFEGWRFYGAA